MSQDLILTSKR
uniref:Uncharacterized protein n=1 Tax=Anguilla anguilla TaxID=7936 RepID=A0A0E9U927_ANGAN